MTIEGLAVLALIVAVFIGWRLVKFARKVARRVGNRLVDRAVDAVLFVLLFKWLKGRGEQRAPRPPVLQGDALFRTCAMSKWGEVANFHPDACRWCGEAIPARRGGPLCSSKCDREYRRNHVFGGAGGAREAALERDGDACTNCGSAVSPEVDHIDAALGRHAQVDCIHHLDNLRTLCGGGGNSCHQQRTNRQRRERHGARARRRRRGAWT